MDERTLNELLECSICFFRLKGDSRVLPCQHTFCFSCLLQVASRSNKHSFHCPECRQPTNMRVEDLPKNVLLNRLLENMKNLKSNSPTPVTSSTAPQIAESSGKQQKEASQTKEEIILVPYAKALFDFPGGTKEQLSFEKGEKILLQKKIDQIWYKGQIHNRAGLFPINHVQVVIPLPHPQCKALYDFRMGPNEKEGCLEFRKGAIIDVIRRVDQNWVEGKIAEKVGIFPLSFVELNPEGHKLVNEGEVRAVPATVVSSSAKSPVQQAPRTSPPQQINPVGPKPASNEHQNKVGVIHPEDPRYQGRFVAIYPYKPQKKDELELKKGGHYYISEKCQDGWCKGYSADNPFIHGMFPGNYLMPVIMFQLMMARRAMVLHSQSQNQQSPQNQSQQTSNACYTNPIVMTNPPELPPRNSVRVAPKPSGPVDQKKEESKVHPKKESMGDMFRKQWSKYNKRSHATESGEDCVDGSFSMDNPVFEDLPSPQHQQQPQKLINKNLIEARPIHMRSGSCPSQLLHNEMEEKKNLPPKTPRNAVPPANSNTTPPDGNKRHSANLNVSSPGPATSNHGNSGGNSKPYHRKANSLDLDALDMNSKSQRPKSAEGGAKTVTKERFRCVTPYPPNSHVELELAIGDIILVHKKRDNGWYKGVNLRTNQSGVFPSIFCEPYQEPIILDI